MKCKKVPEGASQHITAGPYSPVLEVNADTLVVISGQVANDKQGNLLGDTFEEQVKYMMLNCKKQLETAGCSLEDVFKVNVYLTDIKNWAKFNEVYMQFMPEPRPVRTCIQAALVNEFEVEIEMWAGK